MAIKDILTWLIEQHARDLDIRPQPAHAAVDLSERVVEVSGRSATLSARTLSNMLNGRVMKPTRHTCQVLARLFGAPVPGLSWTWFHLSTDEFKSRVEEALAGGNGKGREAGALEGVYEAALDWGGDNALEGTYLAYRHAFSANTINRIAREVLHIYRTSGGLEFRMSYLPGTKGRSDVVLEFHGPVDMVGPSIELHGRNAGVGVARRSRTLYASNNGHIERPELENYKLGLLSSTRETDGVPCVACVLLIKVQRPMENEEDLTAFTKAATRTDTFDRIIGGDFVKEDWMVLRLFLDNRPTRSPKNPKDETDVAMGLLEGPGPRDPVLRISQDRFERTMEEVFQRALDAHHIVPTFRGDWTPAHQDEGSAPVETEAA